VKDRKKEIGPGLLQKMLAVCRVIVIVRQQFVDTGPQGFPLPHDCFHVELESPLDGDAMQRVLRLSKPVAGERE
jgi:hypothetical protein